MHAYRLCKSRFSDLDGEGARLYGGRWNSRGNATVYTSSTLSLALLEYLVHVDPSNLPTDLVSIKIEIPDDVTAETFGDDTAPPESIAATYGDAWIKENKALIYIVPSAIVAEQNILLNPRHKEMRRVKIIHIKDFNFDSRLLE